MRILCSTTVTIIFVVANSVLAVPNVMDTAKFTPLGAHQFLISRTLKFGESRISYEENRDLQRSMHKGLGTLVGPQTSDLSSFTITTTTTGVTKIFGSIKSLLLYFFRRY